MATPMGAVDLLRLRREHVDRLAATSGAAGEKARAVDRTPRHVRWALAANAVRSGNATTQIDWLEHIPRTKLFLSDNIAAVEAWASGAQEFRAEEG